MFPYFIPPIIALVSACLNSRLTPQSRTILYYFTTCCGIFIYCCVYLNGSDWPNYEFFFNQVTWSNLITLSSQTHFELGFSFVLLLFKTIGFGFFPFLIVVKSFSLIVISNFFKFYAREYGQGYSANVFLLLFMFYAGNCMYLYVETIIRFSIALAIVVYAYRFLLERRFWIYLFYILIAVTFHKTAFLMLLIYPITKLRISNKGLVIIFASLIIFLTPQFLLIFIDLIGGVIPDIFYLALKLYLTQAAEIGSDILSIGNIVHLFFLLLCIFLRYKFVAQFKDGDKLFVYLIMYFILFYITVHGGSISRITLYLRPLFIVVFLGILKFKFIGKGFVLPLLIAYMLLGLYKTTENKAFLPYTNYFINKIEGIPLSFEERKYIINEKGMEDLK